MTHSFDIDVAMEYGVNCAIILQNLYYWVEKNRANEKHFYDGMYWTYNSVKAFEELFPYLSSKQIRSALNKLIDEGIIVDGNYNDSAYDRTKWYAVTEKGMCFFQKGKHDLPHRANGDTEKDESLYIYKDNNIDITTDINTNINTNIKQLYSAKNDIPSLNDDEKTDEFDEPDTAAIDGKQKKRRSGFIPPTIDEVEAYCKEKGYLVNAEAFVYHYGSKNWMVGKNKMTSWKMAVAGWNARKKNKESRKEKFDRERFLSS